MNLYHVIGSHNFGYIFHWQTCLILSPGDNISVLMSPWSSGNQCPGWSVGRYLDCVQHHHELPFSSQHALYRGSRYPLTSLTTPRAVTCLYNMLWGISWGYISEVLVPQFCSKVSSWLKRPIGGTVSHTVVTIVHWNLIYYMLSSLNGDLHICGVLLMIRSSRVRSLRMLFRCGHTPLVPSCNWFI